MSEIELFDEEDNTDLMDIAQLVEENHRLHSIIKEVRELLSKYNDNESNYYVPVDIALETLDKENI